MQLPNLNYGVEFGDDSVFLLEEYQNIVDSRSLQLTAKTSYDWEICSSQSDRIEKSLLKQYSHAYAGLTLEVFITPTIFVSLVVEKVETETGSSLLTRTGDVIVGKLSVNTTVVIGPNESEDLLEKTQMGYCGVFESSAHPIHQKECSLVEVLVEYIEKQLVLKPLKIFSQGKHKHSIRKYYYFEL
jgi:hypothetical protein